MTQKIKSPWKVFGINQPQTLQLLSRRGPRSPNARLSQHYIGPKMTFWHFSNFYRKKFPGLTKEISCTYWMNVVVLPHDFFQITTPKAVKKCAGAFLSSQETFFWINLKNTRMLFLGRCNVQTTSFPGFYTVKDFCRQILLVSETFPGFPSLGVQNCLKLAI